MPDLPTMFAIASGTLTVFILGFAMGRDSGQPDIASRGHNQFVPPMPLEGPSGPSAVSPPGRHLLSCEAVAVGDCDCPRLDETHRYSDRCFTSCPICQSVARCMHDNEHHLARLRREPPT